MSKRTHTPRKEDATGCCYVHELATQEATRTVNRYCRGHENTEMGRPETDLETFYREHC